MKFYLLHVVNQATERCLMTLEFKTEPEAIAEEAIYKELGYHTEITESSDAPLFQVIGEAWGDEDEERRY